ncbi:MAG: hypothetical protein AAGM38_14500 [Pseudomonadota bacterium]
MFDLSTLPLFAAATEAQAEALLDASEIVSAAPGDQLFPAFSVTDAYWVLIDGDWAVTRRVAGTPRLMFEASRPGTWTGGIPVIDRIAPPAAEIRAWSRFLKIPSRAVEALVSENPGVAARLLDAVHWGAGHIGGLIETDFTSNPETDQ